ncbi:DUF4157 domain-containing protein [Microcoleus sp.]|uniref:DUF4157 domain-containing protein n=1 Tax=Microcoleus sp. TaxID=44472 RepID=UPI00403E8616
MTHQHVSRTNQQSKSDTPLVSGILQRAAVRNVPQKDVQPIEEEATPFRESQFRYDFSQVPVSTDEMPRIQPKLKIGAVADRTIQGKSEMTGNSQVSSEVPRSNKTGLPDRLKTGIESFSGYSMDDVRVHYNSPKPAQLQALAYAQGTEIHVASGQEQHLPHEAWHVVQQMQGRVRPTMQTKGVQINEDEGLEREADEIGLKAISVNSKNKQATGKAANPVSVVQAIRSVATFQGQTPGSLRTPRRTIKSIDTALDQYINNRGLNKLNMANALLVAIQTYLNTPNHDPARVGVVQALQVEAQLEQNLLNELGAANGGLFDDLIQRVGGLANIAPLTAVAHQITAAYAAQLLHLVTLAGGAANLVLLQNLIQHIQPVNAFLLSGLIPLAGGYANLGLLDNLIQHITPANAMLLFPLIPLANTLNELDALIQVTGVAHVNLLVTMIPNAGGAAAVPLLTNAINLSHAGQGNLAQALTAVAAGNFARFQQLTTILPQFTQQPAGAVAIPGIVQNAVTAYNAHPGPPFNRRIGQINFAHFLERHTHRFFDFGQIGNVNDQWPFFGSPTPALVANALVAALHDLRGRAAWIQPNVAQVVNAGGYQTSVGVLAGGPNLAHPANPLAPPIASLILGQFFPHPGGGGGVIPMDRDAMNAIHRLI